MQTVSLRPPVSLWTQEECQGHCDYLPTSPPTSTMTPDLSTWSLVPLPREPACPAPLCPSTPWGTAAPHKMPGLQATHWEVTSNSSDSRLPRGAYGGPGGVWTSTPSIHAGAGVLV